MAVVLKTSPCLRDHYSFWNTALGTNTFLSFVRSFTLSPSYSPGNMHPQMANSRGKQGALKSIDQSKTEVI